MGLKRRAFCSSLTRARARNRQVNPTKRLISGTQQSRHACQKLSVCWALHNSTISKHAKMGSCEACHSKGAALCHARRLAMSTQRSSLVGKAIIPLVSKDTMLLLEHMRKDLEEEG